MDSTLELINPNGALIFQFSGNMSTVFLSEIGNTSFFLKLLDIDINGLDKQNVISEYG